MSHLLLGPSPSLPMLLLLPPRRRCCCLYVICCRHPVRHILPSVSAPGNITTTCRSGLTLAFTPTQRA